MEAVETQHQSLVLDRSRSNLQFASWRLTRGLVKSAHALGLGGAVATQEGETDYIHTRLAALHNHLHAQPGGLYLFLRTAEGLALARLPAGAADAQLETLAVLSEEAAVAQPPLLDPALPPSVAEVLGPGGGEPLALLASTGRGGLVLLQRGSGAAGTAWLAASATVHPLRPPAPLQGARAFCLEAAFRVPGGSDICCVLWAVRARTDTQPSRCEVFAVTLGLGSSSGSGAAPELHVRDVKLLRCSTLPPHGVLAYPEAGSILLALEPASDAGELGGSSGQPGPVQPHAVPVDDSDDPVSPRTLQAAVARLAQFTSEGPAGGQQPPGQWADLYSESGPDGLGDLGQEPACTLYCFNSGLICVGQVACQPHKVLTCHPREGGCLLLALTDDVDCAVVEVAPAAPAATQQGGEGDGSQPLPGFAVAHTASIPALAYITAGKLQRRFLQLAPPGADLAAALVESHRYAYLYKATAAGQEHGKHEVLELGVEGSQGVLGAALLGGGGGAGGQRLLLLTSEELWVYEL